MVRTEPIRTVEDVLDVTLARFCGACGETLNPPGSQCAACGELPDGETRAEAAERLAGEPDAVARAEAVRLREEAGQYLATAEHLFRAADGVLYRSELRQVRDAAQARLADAVGSHERLLPVLAEACKAEEAAAGPLADAFRVHGQAVKAEETARRLRKGAEAETEAAVRLQAAGQVLGRYQGEATAAARAREAAEDAVRQADRAVGDREAERDAAQAALERHATVPLSRDTVLALIYPALRMAQGADVDGRPLDQGERAMLGVAAEALRGAAFSEYGTALAKAEEDRVRAQLAAEEKTRPQVRAVGDGRLSVAWRTAPQPDTAAAGGVTTPAPNLSPAGPMGRLPGLPGLG